MAKQLIQQSGKGADLLSYSAALKDASSDGGGIKVKPEKATSVSRGCVQITNILLKTLFIGRAQLCGHQRQSSLLPRRARALMGDGPSEKEGGSAGKA